MQQKMERRTFLLTEMPIGIDGVLGKVEGNSVSILEEHLESTDAGVFIYDHMAFLRGVLIPAEGGKWSLTLHCRYRLVSTLARTYVYDGQTNAPIFAHNEVGVAREWVKARYPKGYDWWRYWENTPRNWLYNGTVCGAVMDMPLSTKRACYEKWCAPEPVATKVTTIQTTTQRQIVRITSSNTVRVVRQGETLRLFYKNARESYLLPEITSMTVLSDYMVKTFGDTSSTGRLGQILSYCDKPDIVPELKEAILKKSHANKTKKSVSII